MSDKAEHSIEEDGRPVDNSKVELGHACTNSQEQQSTGNQDSFSPIPQPPLGQNTPEDQQLFPVLFNVHPQEGQLTALGQHRVTPRTELLSSFRWNTFPEPSDACKYADSNELDDPPQTIQDTPEEKLFIPVQNVTTGNQGGTSTHYELKRCTTEGSINNTIPPLIPVVEQATSPFVSPSTLERPLYRMEMVQETLKNSFISTPIRLYKLPVPKDQTRLVDLDEDQPFFLIARPMSPRPPTQEPQPIATLFHNKVLVASLPQQTFSQMTAGEDQEGQCVFPIQFAPLPLEGKPQPKAATGKLPYFFNLVRDTSFEPIEEVTPIQFYLFYLRTSAPEQPRFKVVAYLDECRWKNKPRNVLHCTFL